MQRFRGITSLLGSQYTALGIVKYTKIPIRFLHSPNSTRSVCWNAKSDNKGFFANMFKVFSKPFEEPEEEISPKMEDEQLPLGLEIKVFTKGDGQTFPMKGDIVTLHYTGTLLNGEKFDSSREKNKPFQFIINAKHVIAGWELAVPKMSLGERAFVTIPPELGFGSIRVGPIPPDSTLVFDIELLAITRKNQTTKV